MSLHRPKATGQQLQIVVVGHVDHGKSTLIGRLLYDTDSLPDGKFDEVKAVSEKRGMPVEWSFVLDAFQAERDQAITIDTTQIWFETEARPYVIIDAPGHREFLKNMISGAALAEAALLVVDAEKGVREQSRRHAYLLHLLGLRQIAVVVNKMDRVDHSAERFHEVKSDIVAYLDDLGMTPTAVVPVSARHGDNLSARSTKMGWYEGPTVLEALDGFAPVAAQSDQPLRLPVQDVYKFDERRIIAGRVESGQVSVGDTVVFSPSNRTATVRSLEAWGTADPPFRARAGQSVGITLDEQVFVERGDVVSHVKSAPCLSNVFRATLFWLGKSPLSVGDRFRLKVATDEAWVTVASIEHKIDTQTLASDSADRVERNDVAEVILRSPELLSLDSYRSNPATGRCVLVDGFDTVAGGTISLDGYPDQRRQEGPKAQNLTAVEHLLTADGRARRNGHQGAVVWFTGLSGAGKSTLAMQVEKRLFALGMQVYVLDGDNVRHGLNSDLGFAPEDRVENIRRVGEAAALFADAGIIVITAFISPYRGDRTKARQAAGGENFHEVYIKADLETCEERDPKGLYRKARSGAIKEFTGVSAPYEPPETAELVVDTMSLDVEASVDLIVDYVRDRLVINHRPSAVANG
ncbi:MAG: adenylyl-sulfate kinase [Pseudomonadota bacterium]